MKIAPIIKALDSRQATGGVLRYRLVHTGQHYDPRMSRDFFEQLGARPCALAFVDAVKGGGACPIPLEEVLEVSRVSIEVQGALA